uniref:Abnormal spindle-like microcephaly-associated protein n=1 Tax=Calidris pygmaea TaxID=425635 RepID=A0A8C3JCN1_9CHAR
MNHAVRTIQKHYRASVIGQKQRQEYVQLRNSVVHLQALWRGKTVRKTIQKKHNLATVIQSYYRIAYCMKKKQRAIYLRTKAAVLVLQSAYRGMTVRKQLSKLNKAATIIQQVLEVPTVGKQKVCSILYQSFCRSCRLSPCSSVPRFD